VEIILKAKIIPLRGGNMKLKTLTALTAMSLAASAVWADDSSNVSISGFGTAALTRTNTSDAEFARPNQLAGVTTGCENGVDSNFGIQVLQTTDWLCTGQGLVRKNAQIILARN
jgi:hypothetical protein